MSMNLYCDELELWQTPTWITYVALYDSNSDARGVEETQHIYLKWVESHADGSYASSKDYKHNQDRIRLHKQDVIDANIKDFYMM